MYRVDTISQPRTKRVTKRLYVGLHIYPYVCIGRMLQDLEISPVSKNIPSFGFLLKCLNLCSLQGIRWMKHTFGSLLYTRYIQFKDSSEDGYGHSACRNDVQPDTVVTPTLTLSR